MDLGDVKLSVIALDKHHNGFNKWCQGRREQKVGMQNSP